MKNNITNRFNLYLIIAIILLMSLLAVFNVEKDNIDKKLWSYKYSQPELQSGQFPWNIRSVDTQVISKHWLNVDNDSISTQVSMIKRLGVNYIAVDTPYDRKEELAAWVNEIHAQGLNVWFRCHWDSWEGDDGRPATMTPEEYLNKTRSFIVNNPTLFIDGDSFTVAVEAEQVDVGLGKKFLTWDEYRNFLLSEISVASDAFKEIGLGGKIHTNWLSMNGWVVENQLTQDIVDKMGIIVVDHFVGQSKTIGSLENEDEMVDLTVKDLDAFYEKWNKPILLGEWGYQIYQDVPDTRQAQVIDKMMARLKDRPYLIGVNYWVHMGNSASIISDVSGKNLKYKGAAAVIKKYYDPSSVDVLTSNP